ncbi:MAG: hypothetical protein E6833_27215 [Bradyrhizobium sp.]|nr:hypothetical protein [Bradyrhizobium sp.]
MAAASCAAFAAASCAAFVVAEVASAVVIAAWALASRGSVVTAKAAMRASTLTCR